MSITWPISQRYLDGIPLKLMALVLRDQGFMVLRGNPKNIKDLGDLGKPGIRFVNRQRGAGTRVLLDYQLALKGISVRIPSADTSRKNLPIWELPRRSPRGERIAVWESRLRLRRSIWILFHCSKNAMIWSFPRNMPAAH